MHGSLPASFKGAADTKQACEWAGAAAGILGSLLIATGSVGFGFCLFLVSNAFLLGYAIMARAFGIGAMQLIYTGTSLYGIFHWLL